MADIKELIPRSNNLNRFFREERQKAIRYIVKRYFLSEEEAEDCFQEGCYAMLKKVRSDQLNRETLTCSLSTYLMRCCCHHATHCIEKQIKMVSSDDVFSKPVDSNNDDDNDDKGTSIEPIDSDDISVKDEQMQILMDVIPNLPEPCNKILWGVYYNYRELKERGNDNDTVMDVLAQMLGMSKTVLKTTKNRCMKKLKTKINSLLNE